MVIGTVFNVCGRVYLKSNWADHVRIYDDQQLVTTGPYRIVRHPLTHLDVLRCGHCLSESAGGGGDCARVHPCNGLPLQPGRAGTQGILR